MYRHKFELISIEEIYFILIYISSQREDIRYQ